jgi:hypothetical protein
VNRRGELRLNQEALPAFLDFAKAQARLPIGAASKRLHRGGGSIERCESSFLTATFYSALLQSPPPWRIA